MVSNLSTKRTIKFINYPPATQEPQFKVGKARKLCTVSSKVNNRGYKKKGARYRFHTDFKVICPYDMEKTEDGCTKICMAYRCKG